MEIILLEKIRNLGELGDAVNVKNGYARNFLLPQKKAVRATADAKASVEERRRQLAEEHGQQLDSARARAGLAVRQVELVRLCAEEGRLYGSVSAADIAKAMTEAMADSGIQIDKSEVVLSDGAIKQTGEFEGEVVLHPEVRFGVRIVVSEQQEHDE